MVNPQVERISDIRRELENPYAYIEELEALRSAADRQPEVAATEAEVAASRKLLENPYAHLDGSGGVSGLKRSPTSPRRQGAKLAKQAPVVAVSATPTAKSARQITVADTEIEQKVREIHERLWRERFAIWGTSPPTDPIQLLDPAAALGLIGYDYQLDEGLGRTRGANGMLEVAGIIDRTSRTVRISSQFPDTIRTFTAAHELGHPRAGDGGEGEQDGREDGTEHGASW